MTEEIRFKLQKLEQWLEIDVECQSLKNALRQVEAKRRHLESFFFNKDSFDASISASLSFENKENVENMIQKLREEAKKSQAD
jgi:hypothetical protein